MTRITLQIDGVTVYERDDTPPPPPPPPPSPDFPALYRIIDDIEASKQPKWTRPFVRDGLPSTVRIWGGAGTVLLPPAWMDFAHIINPKPLAYNYQFMENGDFKPAVGWHNGGAGNKVEQLTFSGNWVMVKEIVGDKAFIETLFTDEPIPFVLLPTPPEHNGLIHAFTVQYDDHLDYEVAGARGPRYPRVFLIANPGEKLWIPTIDLVKV